MPVGPRPRRPPRAGRAGTSAFLRSRESRPASGRWPPGVAGAPTHGRTRTSEGSGPGPGRQPRTGTTQAGCSGSWALVAGDVAAALGAHVDLSRSRDLLLGVEQHLLP